MNSSRPRIASWTKPSGLRGPSLPWHVWFATSANWHQSAKTPSASAWQLRDAGHQPETIQQKPPVSQSVFYLTQSQDTAPLACDYWRRIFASGFQSSRLRLIYEIVAYRCARRPLGLEGGRTNSITPIFCHASGGVPLGTAGEAGGARCQLCARLVRVTIVCRFEPADIRRCNATEGEVW